MGRDEGGIGLQPSGGSDAIFSFHLQCDHPNKLSVAFTKYRAFPLPCFFRMFRGVSLSAADVTSTVSISEA